MPTVELKWNKLPVDTEVGLNQDVGIECDAIGQPQPQITWTKHPTSTSRGSNGKIVTTNDHHLTLGNFAYTEYAIHLDTKSIAVSQGKVLKLNKVQNKDSGLYECVARNGVDQDLRRIIQIRVRGKLSR